MNKVLKTKTDNIWNSGLWMSVYHLALFPVLFFARALDTTSSLMKSFDIVTGRLSGPPLGAVRGRVGRISLDDDVTVT